MARHSKWNNIKHRKAIFDAKKGKVFTSLSRLITIAAQKGSDPAMNASLRVAIEKAKAASLPADNIERAVKKGTGELKGEQMKEITYEGYGPGGVAILIRCLTDNTNRSIRNIRTIMDDFGGSIGASGCVSWMFVLKGVIEANVQKNDELELRLIDAGAEDISWEENMVRVTTTPEGFEQCAQCFEQGVQKSETTLVPKEEKFVSNMEIAQKIVGLLDSLENDDDVVEVISNVQFPEEVFRGLSTKT